jgi:hypothetical protein
VGHSFESIDATADIKTVIPQKNMSDTIMTHKQKKNLTNTTLLALES